jgi:hypothetical protein
MSDLGTLGKWIIVIGLGVVALGGLVWLAGRVGMPLGRLPGDIRIERGPVTAYFPCATSIIVSLLLTVLLNVVVRLFNR